MTIQFYNNKQAKIYNIDLKNTQYVRFSDIETLADTLTNNYFYYFNFFNEIRVKTINNVSGNVFDYLANLQENIQAFITLTRNLLTNFSYADNKTSILNTLETLNIECDDVKSNFIASNNINVSKINCNKITCSTTQSRIIQCNEIQCKKMESLDDIGVYLYVNSSLCIPLNKSLSLTTLNLTGITINDLKITIKPNYYVEFYMNNSLVSVKNNNTTNIIYFFPINILEFTKIKIYFKNIILL